MDTTQITIPKKEIAPGVYTTGGIATAPTNSPAVITADSLKAQNPINIATPVEPEIPNVAGDVAFLQNLQNQQSAEEQQLAKQRDNANIGIENLLKEISGQGTEQLSLEQQYVNPIKTQLNDVTSQINTQLAEYQQAQALYEKAKSDIEAGAGRKGITTSAVLGQQGAIDRAKAAELNVKASGIALLQAKAQAIQGNLTLAQDNVNRAIDLKYKGKEQELAIRQFQLDNIKENLTSEQKKRADALTYALNKEEKRLAEQKDNEKIAETFIVNAIQGKAPQSLISKAQDLISKGAKATEVASVLGDYSLSASDRLDLRIKQAQYDKLNSEMNSITVNSPVTEKVDATITLKNLISDLATGSGKRGAVGAGFQKLIPGFLKGGSQFIAGTKAAGYEATFNQLKDTLAFENISKLKGAMSDKDIQFLRNIGTKLSLGMSEKEFNQELLKLDETMNNVLIQNGVDPSTINSYSALDNDTLLNLPQGQVTNSQFFK